MIKKGMVVKIKNKYAIVGTENSQFHRIRIKESLRIGQKIYFDEGDIVGVDVEEATKENLSVGKYKLIEMSNEEDKFTKLENQSVGELIHRNDIISSLVIEDEVVIIEGSAIDEIRDLIQNSGKDEDFDKQKWLERFESEIDEDLELDDALNDEGYEDSDVEDADDAQETSEVEGVDDDQETPEVEDVDDDRETSEAEEDDDRRDSDDETEDDDDHESSEDDDHEDSGSEEEVDE